MNWNDYWYYVVWAGLLIIPAAVAICGVIIIKVVGENSTEDGAGRWGIAGICMLVSGVVFFVGAFASGNSQAYKSITPTTKSAQVEVGK